MGNRGPKLFLFSLSLLLHAAVRPLAAEPNETFETATILAPGVQSVVDAFPAPGEPDAMLAILGQFGDVEFVEDGSPLGNDFAPGAAFVPTNSGSIDFVVTGTGDFDLNGGHGETGFYEVFVDVYDFADELIAEFREIRRLEPGSDDGNYSLNDPEWIGGTYDVYVDNVISGDVDFYTFTGLTPGEPFTAETIDPAAAEIDTLLGWFGEGGVLLAVNDDFFEENLLSSISGFVPENGQLTFAVSGYGDDSFVGAHPEAGPYELRLSVEAGLAADFNGDNQVDSADFLAWRRSFAENDGADADGDLDSDGADFLAWQREFGLASSGGLTIAVPEPSSAIIAASALWCISLSLRRKRIG